jgi:hypothetical protein
MNTPANDPPVQNDTPRNPARWLLYLGIPALVAGSVGFGIGHGVSGLGAFVGAFVFAFIVLVGAGWYVDFAGRISPKRAMIAAMLNFILILLVFLLLLALLKGSDADLDAVAVGLIAATLPFAGWHLAKANVKARQPVTETLLPWDDDDDDD